MSEPNIRAEYLAHIPKQKLSGLSIKQYCEQNNLMEHKFSYYRNYKLKAGKTKKDKAAFAPVKVIQEKSPAVEKRPDPVWLAQFVKSLMD